MTLIIEKYWSLGSLACRLNLFTCFSFHFLVAVVNVQLAFAFIKQTKKQGICFYKQNQKKDINFRSFLKPFPSHIWNEISVLLTYELPTSALVCWTIKIKKRCCKITIVVKINFPDVNISLPLFEGVLFKVRNVLKICISNNKLVEHKILGIFSLQRGNERRLGN